MQAGLLLYSRYFSTRSDIAISSRASLGTNDILLSLVQIVDQAILKVKVSLHHRRGRQGQPLRQADILSDVFENPCEYVIFSWQH